MNKVEKIAELLTRGVENIIPGKKPLEELLSGKNKLNIQPNLKKNV
jgi:hypothetical protein